MEVWKDIEGFEAYQVSNMGRIKKGHRIIRPKISSTGVYYINLHKKSRTYRKYLHTLIASLFLNPPPYGKPFIGYKNDDKMDIRSDNLKWVSGKEKYKDNITIPAHTTPLEVVQQILVLAETMRQCEIVRMFSMNKQTVSRILLKQRCSKVYKHNL